MEDDKSQRIYNTNNLGLFQASGSLFMRIASAESSA
jgi:hypothetical protein